MIELRKVSKTYHLGQHEVVALENISLDISNGEFACIVGPSGAGKSTLLHLIGCLDTPTTGEIRFDGRPVNTLSDDDLSRLRRDQIGIIFQFFNLLPTLSAEENIALPQLIAGRRLETIRAKVDHLLEVVKLTHRRRHKPDQLSGGEMQRVAIARAMINDPSVILADEPTGNVDSANGEIIISLLKDISGQGKCSVIVATHNAELARQGDSLIALRDGKLEAVTANTTAS